MPIDRELGLPGLQFTSRVELWVGRLCAKDTFVGAMEDLSGLARVSVSSKEAQRITISLGEQAEKMMEDDMARVLPRHKKCTHIQRRNPEAVGKQYQDPKLTGYVSMDGAMVPTAEMHKDEQGKRRRQVQYTEAKMGRVDLVQEPRKDGEEAETISSRFTFSMDGADECARRTYVIAARAGVTRLSRLVAIADGAEWIWKRIKQYFPHAIQILDWYHATEHLGEVVRTCVLSEVGGGDGSGTTDEASLKAECKRLVDTGKALMREGKIAQLVKFVSALPQGTAEAVERVRETVGYYRNNSKRMKYAEYRARGLRIGSGPMESTCKQIVDARMRKAGMSWSPEGARAVGLLRSELLSTGCWDRVFENWPGRPICAAS